ncbi:MAG: hypothetical protein WCT36_02770, partial [Candidatus Gracilibacteria bacterium]
HARMDADVNIDLPQVDAVDAPKPAQVAEVAPAAPAASADEQSRVGLGRSVVHPSTYLNQFPVIQDEVQPALDFFKSHQQKSGHGINKGVEDALATNFGAYIPLHVLSGVMREVRVAAGLSETSKDTIHGIVKGILNRKLKNSPYTIESVEIAYEQPDPTTGRRSYIACRMIRKPGADGCQDVDGDAVDVTAKIVKGREKPSKIYEPEELNQFPLIEEEVQPALDWFKSHRRGPHSDARIFEYLFSTLFGKYILRSSLESDVSRQRQRLRPGHSTDKKPVAFHKTLNAFKQMKLKDSPYTLERISVYCDDGQFCDGARKYDYAYRMVKKVVEPKKDKMPDREELASLPIVENHVQSATKVVEDNFLLGERGSKGVSRAIFLFLAKNVGRYFAPSNSDWLSFVSDQVKGGSGSVNSGSFHATLVSASGIRLTDLLSKIGLKLDKRTCKGLGKNVSCTAFGIVPIEK